MAYKDIVRREVWQVSKEQFSKTFILSIAAIDCIMMYRRLIGEKAILQFYSILDKHQQVDIAIYSYNEYRGEEPKLR